MSPAGPVCYFLLAALVPGEALSLELRPGLRGTERALQAHEGDAPPQALMPHADAETLFCRAQDLHRVAGLLQPGLSFVAVEPPSPRGNWRRAAAICVPQPLEHPPPLI
jgi:hypothetical protein